MTSVLSEQKKLLKYTVWGLDVWGHSSGDCHEHDCPCMKSGVAEGIAGTPNGTPIKYHDDNVCDCSYDVNDRSRCGVVEIEVTGEVFNAGTEHEFTSFVPDDKQILMALRGDLLNDHVTLDDIDIESSDGEVYEINEKKDGRPIFQLEKEGEKEEMVGMAKTEADGWVRIREVDLAAMTDLLAEAYAGFDKIVDLTPGHDPEVNRVAHTQRKALRHWRRDTVSKPRGFHVMTWGGGRYTSVSFHGTREEADRECKKILTAGSWRGMPPKVEAAS